MKISGKVFNGYVIPKILGETTNFNSSSYGELDIVNSMFRGKVLLINTGKNSDEQKYFCIRIEGLGEVEDALGYYSDSIFIWGKWTELDILNEEIPENNKLEKEFIGFVSNFKKGSANFYLNLNPVLV